MVDYRLPEHRRETFLKFYEYHLRNRGHAGAVYYVFPYLFDTLRMHDEQRLWFAFINGCTQHPITTYMIWKEFPNLEQINIKILEEWYEENRTQLPFDTDRRYTRTKFVHAVKSYLNALQGQSQRTYFTDLCDGDEHHNFRQVWEQVINRFETFGRLSTFSYLEYLRLTGLQLDCDQLFLDDISGSKSHRNGLCKVMGRDDLDWWKQDKVDYTEHLGWLEQAGKDLLAEAKERIDHPDVSYFTLETTLCCYKGWHRVNRRYPNVYNDMFHDRIRKAERLYPDEDLSLFWKARKWALPKHLRQEDNPLDKGLCKEKQNHYRHTGEVIMMEEEGFKVSSKPWHRKCVLITGCCGVGKTWTMKQLLTPDDKAFKLGKFNFHENDDWIVVGKYDGSTFEGSDRLSMSVMTDLNKMLAYIEKKGKLAVFEGDRFSNSKFIAKADPVIINIEGDGAEGRNKRGSNQSERHLKSITTRVSNLPKHTIAKNSSVALNHLKMLLCEHSNSTK
jgi:hypothetical protein